MRSSGLPRWERLAGLRYLQLQAVQCRVVLLQVVKAPVGHVALDAAAELARRLVHVEGLFGGAPDAARRLEHHLDPHLGGEGPERSLSPSRVAAHEDAELLQAHGPLALAPAGDAGLVHATNAGPMGAGGGDGGLVGVPAVAEGDGLDDGAGDGGYDRV